MVAGRWVRCGGGNMRNSLRIDFILDKMEVKVTN